MKYIFLIAILFITLSCSDLTSGKRFEETSPVMTGLLYEGQSINPDNPIFIGKTIDIESGNFFDILIPDAEVKLINHTFSDTIDLVFLPIDLHEIEKIGYIDPNWNNENAMIIAAGNHYIIQANLIHNEEPLTVSAETTIPESILLNPTNDPSFTFSEVSDYPQLSYEIANIEHPLRIETNSAEAVNLFFRFYCLESFENAYYIQEYPGMEDTPETQIEYEHPVSGMPRKMEFWWTYQPAWNDDFDKFLITDRGYKASFIFYGNYEIQIYSVDDNYYQYLYQTNGFMNGGIENGFGYFGSVSGGKLFTKVVE